MPADSLLITIISAFSCHPLTVQLQTNLIAMAQRVCESSGQWAFSEQRKHTHPLHPLLWLKEGWKQLDTNGY